MWHTNTFSYDEHRKTCSMNTIYQLWLVERSKFVCVRRVMHENFIRVSGVLYCFTVIDNKIDLQLIYIFYSQFSSSWLVLISMDYTSNAVTCIVFQSHFWLRKTFLARYSKGNHRLQSWSLHLLSGSIGKFLRLFIKLKKI